MNFLEELRQLYKQAIKKIYNYNPVEKEIQIISTRKEFDGELTLTIFPLIKVLKTSPKDLGKNIGEYLLKNSNFIHSYNVVSGFLNLEFTNKYWLSTLHKIHQGSSNTHNKIQKKKYVIEFPGPNTNKPLHLGHLRNIFLGMTISNILEAAGHQVCRVNIVNNRGIHICKSMLAYKKFGNNETPETTNSKGDHFVGKYYVKFDQEYKQELEQLAGQGYTKEEALKKSILMHEVNKMLQDWEEGDKEVVSLWKKMNNWVYEGFDKTYERLGLKFVKTYYESDTYLLGKDIILEGLADNLFYKKKDESIWIDLEDVGLDQKLVLRSDGTSVYITQDIGTAEERYKDFKYDESIYVVGSEQDYHFKVLFEIMKKLNKPYSKNMYHLSYGMVDLPSGKMKSREGTVVDADNLLDDMYQTAKKATLELGKIEGFSESEADKLFNELSQSALRYFLLKVDPKKRILFDPEASIDFNGDTGPFIQYTYVRINSLLKKAKSNWQNINIKDQKINLNKHERILIALLNKKEAVLEEAIKNLNPSGVAHYIYEVAKSYNAFYSECNILNEENLDLVNFRLFLSNMIAQLIKSVLSLLQIYCPERM